MRSPDNQPELGKRRSQRRGMTLVELAVTLVVLMLAAVVAVPSFIQFQQAQQLQWAARRTMALAGEARGLAASGETVVKLEFDPGGHGMRMTVEPPDDDSQDAPPAPGAEPPLGERRTPDSRFLPLPLEVSVKIERDRQSEEPALLFYPDGRSDPVRLRLEREGYPPIVLAMNSRTGRLRAEEQTQ